MALGGEGRAGPPAAGSDSGKKRAREPAPRRAPRRTGPSARLHVARPPENLGCKPHRAGLGGSDGPGRKD